MSRRVKLTCAGIDDPYTIYDDHDDEIPASYDVAEVYVDDPWAFYSKDYHKNQGGEVIVVRKGKEKKLGFKPTFARQLAYGNDGCALFEHVGLHGKMKLFTENCPDLSKDFPAGTGAGASSAVVHPADTWHCFSKAEYAGGQTHELSPENGGVYKSFPNFNDKAKSMRRK